MLFRPDRSREPDKIRRPPIVVAVDGRRERALRFDPFSMGAHYHIRPGLAPQVPLSLGEGRSLLEATLAFFEKPLRFRGLLAMAEEDEAAARLGDEELRRAALEIRALATPADKAAAA